MNVLGGHNVFLKTMDVSGAPELPREDALSSNVLVLNRNYVAIRVISAKRAFILLYKGFSEVIDTEEERFGSVNFESWIEYSEIREMSPDENDQFVVTPRWRILVPRVIRLVNYDKIPKRGIKFSRNNIMARDEHRCQYCSKKLSPSQLTLDHVVPRSRGGKSTWTNVVAACPPCNTRKGGRLPSGAGMKLQRAPAPPRKNPILLAKVDSERYRPWRYFLKDEQMAIEA